MRGWALAAGAALLLAGCSYLFPDSYETALKAPPPTPRTGEIPDQADLRALAPYQSAGAPRMPPSLEPGKGG